MRRAVRLASPLGLCLLIMLAACGSGTGERAEAGEGAGGLTGSGGGGGSGGSGGGGSGGSETGDSTPPTTTATPSGGIFPNGPSVTLTCDDGTGSGCVATYFTMDGTAPTTSSARYTTPIPLAASIVLKFFSVDAKGNQESVKSEVYAVTNPSTVSTTVSPAGGTYSSARVVTLTCTAPAGFTCQATYYTLDGSAPTTASTAYAGPITIGRTTTLRFFSIDQNGRPETTQSAVYLIDGVAPVTTAAPAGAISPSAVQVSLSCDDNAGSGCEGTYYTVDGSAPSTSSTRYTGPIAIAANTTLKYFSVDVAGNQEIIRSQSYVIDSSAPTTTATPAGGTFAVAQSVTLTCEDGAAGSGCSGTYYTLDGSAPSTSSPRYGGPIALTATATLRFMSVDSAGNAEGAQALSFLIDGAAPVSTATPPGGTFNSDVTVTLGCTDGGAGCDAIFFTTDGSIPTVLADRYTGPFTLTTTTTLRYFAVDLAGNAEDANTQTYLVDRTAPFTDVYPPPGTFSGYRYIDLYCVDGAGSGCAQTYYTIDGTTPTTASPVYSGSIYIGSTTTLKYFSTDFAGNVEKVGTATYVVDGTPPVTAVTPAGGTYKAAQQVTLTCTDVGTGCDKIYYTTTGLPPTNASPVYSGPITISSTTLLQFFATDLAGNVEVVHTLQYIIDTTPPTVTSTSPANGQRSVPQTSAITITFSEAMDPSSVTASTIKVSNGGTAISGTVSYAATTATFTPSSTLPVDSTITVTLTTGARDVAQNPLAAAYAFSFMTVTPTLQVSGSGSATMINRGLAYNNTGDGMAVWLIDSGTACSFVYATYSGASGTWSAEQPLYTSTGFGCSNGDLPLDVASNGLTFMVVWKQGFDIVAREYAAGIWAAPATIMKNVSWTYTFNTVHIASNGSGYAVTFPHIATVQQTFASVYDGATWTTPVSLQSDRNPVNQPMIAGGPAGYVVTWTAGVSAYANCWVPGVGWAASETLIATGASGWAYGAVGTTSYAAAVAQSSQLAVLIGSGGTFGAATTVSPPLGSSSVGLQGMASNGSGFAMAFHAYLSTGYQALASVYAAGAWSPAQQVDSATGQVYDMSIVSGGTGYGVVVQRIATSYDVYANVYNGSSWGAAWALENSSAKAQRPRVARRLTGYAASWDQDDGMMHQIEHRLFMGTKIGPLTGLVASSQPTSVTNVHLARATGLGQVMAVWQQQHRGGNAVFASRWNGSSWTTPELITTDGGIPGVAASNNGFAVAYYDYNTSRCQARIWSGGAFGAAAELSFYACSAPAVASNGSGYVVAYGSAQDARAIIWDGAAWGAETVIDPATATVRANLAAASDGSSYMVGWIQDFQPYVGSAMASRATYGSGTWTWGTAQALESLSTDVSAISIASNGSNYLAAFVSTYSAYANTFSGSAWSTEVAIDKFTGTNYYCSYPSAAASAADYLVSYRCDVVRAARYSGGVWSEAILGTANTDRGSCAGGGGGFSVVWNANADLMGAAYSGSAWDASRPVEWSTAPIDFNSTPAVVYDYSAFLAAWIQQDPSDASLKRLYARRDF